MGDNRAIKFFVISLVFYFSQNVTKCQTINHLRTYNSATILLKDGQLLKDMKISVDKVTVNIDGNATTKSVPLSEVWRIQVQGGSKTGTYAAIGAGIGAVTLLSGLIYVWTDESRVVDEDKALAFGVGVIGGGALIGALIGSSKHTTKTVYSAEKGWLEEKY